LRSCAALSGVGWQGKRHSTPRRQCRGSARHGGTHLVRWPWHRRDSPMLSTRSSARLRLDFTSPPVFEISSSTFAYMSRGPSTTSRLDQRSSWHGPGTNGGGGGGRMRRRWGSDDARPTCPQALSTTDLGEQLGCQGCHTLRCQARNLTRTRKPGLALGTARKSAFLTTSPPRTVSRHQRLATAPTPRMCPRWTLPSSEP
jgi:hypothetical protein